MAGHAAEGPLIRKATTQRFPYVIAFEKHEQLVLVLAVAHAKRKPLEAILHSRHVTTMHVLGQIGANLDQGQMKCPRCI